MMCPFCSYPESKVIDSRPADGGTRIRRRRECLQCGKRFTTYETVEKSPVIVVKHDRSRQPFDRSKLLGGMLRACAKRPVTLERLEKAIDEIEVTLQIAPEREVSSDRLGVMALEKLRDIDEIAYVRFASVYHDFKDIDSFTEELQKLRRK